MTNWSPDIYGKAWDFAAHYHHGQTYGGPHEGERIDYIHHIASVAMETMWAFTEDAGLDENLAIQCALLHDTIEDTAATYDLVKAEFGAAVADGVLALTKDSTIPQRSEQMADSLRRIQRQPKEIWMVKMADRITNLYAPAYYWDDQRIQAYRMEAIQIYDVLYPASQRLADRLAEKISRYRGFLRGSQGNPPGGA